MNDAVGQARLNNTAGFPLCYTEADAKNKTKSSYADLGCKKTPRRKNT